MTTYSNLNAFKSYLNQKLKYNVPALTFHKFISLYNEGFEVQEIIDIQVNQKGLIHLKGNLYRSIYTFDQVIVDNYESLQTPVIRLPMVKATTQEVASQVYNVLATKNISREIKYQIE